ncbi:MAG: SoxR reducing system RseC family protein [Bacteroidia bacterium]|jgi:sigma-E factor negative regulatory protein RseC|nr:SoxR reducing system RseC family protein [Bacteroidia bacterium]
MIKSENFESIEHDGVVQKSDNNSVSVIISVESACSGCHAESLCSLSGTEEKIVEVSGFYNLAPGDNVTVVMKKSSGYKALLLGYIFPLILLMVILIILASSSVPELTAGLASIAALIPYYLILWFFRKRINNKFTFTIKV